MRPTEGEAVIDGGLIAGYLAAAVARGGGRLLDKTVDGALDRLAAAVSSKLMRLRLGPPRWWSGWRVTLRVGEGRLAGLR